MRYCLWAVLVCLISLQAAAQNTDAPKVPPPPRDYRCEGTGELFVYGTFRNNTGQAIKGRIELSRSGESIRSTDVEDDDGRYCIRYNSGKYINTLKFFLSRDAKGIRVEIQLIAGDRSHIINKILDTRVGAIETRADVLEPQVAKARYGPITDNWFIIRVDFFNNSNSSARIVNVWFDLGKSTSSRISTPPDPTQPGLSTVATSTSPELVAQLVANRGTGFSLFRIGPLSVFNISRTPNIAQTLENIYHDSLKPNEILPANQMIQRTVFFSRGLVSLSKSEAKNPRVILNALGTFHVTAVRMEDGEVLTSRFSPLRSDKLERTQPILSVKRTKDKPIHFDLDFVNR